MSQRLRKGSVFYTNGFRSYNDLKQYGKHNVIRHDKDEFAKEKNHINGIEGFWSFAKERFHKYHGIDKKELSVLLKRNGISFQS